jgi:hypothetical protein
MAFRAMPKMSNKLMIQVFGPFRRDQFVAALDAIDSEQATWIGRLRHHRISAAAILGQAIEPLILANETFVMLNIVTSHFSVSTVRAIKMELRHIGPIY